MKESTKKEIEESIADLEKMGAKREPLVMDVIQRLRNVVELEEGIKEEKDGPGTKN